MRDGGAGMESWFVNGKTAKPGWKETHLGNLLMPFSLR